MQGVVKVKGALNNKKSRKPQKCSHSMKLNNRYMGNNVNVNINSKYNNYISKS